MTDPIAQPVDDQPLVLTGEPEVLPHQDISFDLETLALKADATILSIGAVKFDRITGELGEKFYRVIDITSPLGGGSIDPSTVVWWMNQSQEARDVVFGNNPAYKAARVDLRTALVEFSEFIGFNESLPPGEYPDISLWQRGDKDGLWLTSAYEGMNLATPFRYWQLENQRTLTALFKPFMPENPGVAHDALADAVYQAECLVNVFRRLTSCGAMIPDKPAVVGAKPTVAPAQVREDVLSMAWCCGLGTVAEAIGNMQHHAMSLWAYGDIDARLAEVDAAFEGFTGEELVVDLLSQEKRDAIDVDIDAHARGNESADDIEQIEPLV